MQNVLTRTMVRTILCAVTAAAIGVSAAQANPRPLAGLERFYVTQTTHSASLPVYGIGDNMSYYGQQLAKKAAKKTVKTPKATRPDDRAGMHGIGATLLTSKVAVANDTSDVVVRFLSRLATVRPDDRGGVHGIGVGQLPASFGRWDTRLVLR
jgi:hypothetical protein